eukprot:GFUD01028209.1.p1 GENE.GFUD01028209.1~~GFUD01028209.1.p1  ORF type:complete len:816 (+),score=121.42 GFUD01028209.1:274-2721(+)
MNETGSGTTTANINLSPPNTHHVKQLLATYARNAPLSLTGPSGIEEQTRNNKYKFKLNDDVSLSKVYPGEGGTNGSLRKDANFEPNGQVYEQLNKQIMLQRERIMRQYQEQFMQAEKDRDRSRERQLSGRTRQNSGQDRTTHLSGEQIRKLRESQKQQERQRAEEERRSREARNDGKDGRGKSAFKPPQSVPNTTIPIMSSSDTSWSELEDTSLEGEQISCFNVGGEFRLCLPQILNSVLEKVSLQAINQACDELQIFCSTCSADQLQVLKDAKVLPVAAHQCGLITKSDAERLCSHLLDKNPPRASVFDPKSSPFSFKVQHECLGRCEGLVLPEAYTTPNARCIECLQCEGLFSAQKFVCHAHDNTENRTCHWGFDSNHWRTYLQLSEDYTEEEKERHAKVMEDFKNRYVSSGSTKRRQDGDHYEKRDGPSHSKRTKLEDAPIGNMPAPPDPYTAMCMYYSKLSAFRPWSPKAGFPPFQGYPLQPPYNRATPSESPSQESRRPEEANSSSAERYRSESPHVSTVKRKLTSEKEEGRFPTLAEEISTVAEALTGAPVHAKETVLKILERLTQRLDRAERDRDLAIGRYRELQSRYEQLEEELSKKRGELRELLRQDSRLSTTSQDGEEEDVDGGGKGEPNGTKIDSIKEESDSSNIAPENAAEKSQGPLSVIVERGEEDQLSERSAGSSASRLDNFSSAGLPKIELKSPARVMEEAVSPRSQSLSSRNEDRTSAEDVITETVNKFEKQLNHKTKDSENLQERMIKMEAELTALREELSTRSKNGTAAKALSKILSNGDPSPTTNHNNTSVIKKTE